MLKDEDRIFKNLYNDFGEDILSAQKRDDWSNTKKLCSKGRDWIINEIKTKIMYFPHRWDGDLDMALTLFWRLLLQYSQNVFRKVP